MKILIIEDESAVSNDLCTTIVKNWTNLELPQIHQIYSTKEGIEYLKNGIAPDLIFSDIQLGDGVCFDIFKEVSISSPIIFCTAYDDYAIQAFKENGIDYILKPFTSETIKKALVKYEKIKNWFAADLASIDYERLAKLIGKSNDESKVASILVYVRDKIIPIKLEDIALFYLQKNETYLLTFDKKNYFVNKSLDELEKVTGSYYFRANRQFLISRRAINDAYQFFSRKLALSLNVDFEEKIIISKEKKVFFIKWLSEKE